MTIQSILDADRLSLTEAAQRLKRNVATLWRWSSRGVRGRKLPTITIGGRRYVLVSDLEEFLSAGREVGETQPVEPTLTARAVAAGEELTRLGM